MRKQPPASSSHTKAGHPKIRHRKGTGEFKMEPPKQSGGPTISNKPLAPAELDQDSGGGYRQGRVDPQT